MKITESNVTIMVADMDRAVNFYQMLGLTIKNRWGNHYAQLITSDIIIGLHPANGPIVPSTHVSIGFMIEDIKDAESLLSANNVAFQRFDDKAGIFVNFKDPDGTSLYFNQPAWR
jgi:predicted enzyme related to lactoylglutathione lyase